MPSSFNLATEPWIECVDSQGQGRVVGLAELVADAADLTLAEPAAILRPAIWRLLAALCYAAGAHPADQKQYVEQIRDGIDLSPVRAYLDAHADEFDLLHPERPFAQDAELKCAVGTDSERPVLYLDMTAAIDRPLLADERHLASATPMTYRQAAHALLTAQLWGSGGRTQGSAKDLGPTGSTYGIPSPTLGRLVVCPEPGTVAAALSWRVTPTDHPGEPIWSYPLDPPTAVVAMNGEAEGLTWPSRRLLLVPRDGMVEGVVLSRGLRYKEPGEDESIVGWSDLVTTPAAFLAGRAVSRADDPLPIIANFQNSRPGSVLTHLIEAATELGHGPDITVYSLVGDRAQKKIAHAHAVPVPAASLYAPWASEVAAFLVAGRRLVGKRHLADDVDAFLTWLDDPHRLPELLEAARRHLMRRVATHDAPYSRDAVEKTAVVHRAVLKAEDAFLEFDDITTDNAEATEPPVTESPVDPDAASFFEDDLFVDPDRPDAPSRPDTDEPAAVLLSRLVGYVTHPEHRGTLNRLAQYARRPDPANYAMSLAVRDLPSDHLTAATTVAALFAHVHAGKRRPMTGKLPLPRIARSFGGTSRGPANTDVRILIDRATRADAAELLPILTRLVQFLAQSDDARTDWTDLYHTVLAWDEPDARARTRWSHLFYRTQRVDEIDTLLKGNAGR